MKYIKLTDSENVTGIGYNKTTWGENVTNKITNGRKINLCSNGFHYYRSASIRGAALVAQIYDLYHCNYLNSSKRTIEFWECIPSGVTVNSPSKSCSKILTTTKKIKMKRFTYKELCAISKCLKRYVDNKNGYKISLNGYNVYDRLEWALRRATPNAVECCIRVALRNM